MLESIYSYEINKLQAKLVFPGKCCPLRGKDILLDLSKLYLEICAGMMLMQIIAFLPVDFMSCDFFFFLENRKHVDGCVVLPIIFANIKLEMFSLMSHNTTCNYSQTNEKVQKRLPGERRGRGKGRGRGGCRETQVKGIRRSPDRCHVLLFSFPAPLFGTRAACRLDRVAHRVVSLSREAMDASLRPPPAVPRSQDTHTCLKSWSSLVGLTH